MAAIICTCDSPVKNLGLPNCSDNVGIPKRLIFVPTYKTDGTLNFIATASDAITTAAFWNGLQYNADANSRYYPLASDFESVEMAKGDTVYQEFPSGRKEKVRDGVRTFMGQLPKVSAPLVGKLKSKGCSKMSVFIVDDEGKLVGIEKTTGNLYPMQLSDNTMNSIFQYATDTTVPFIPVEFEFAQNNADELISFIPAASIGVDLFTQFNGKMDTNIVQVGTGSATGFTVDIFNDYGNAVTKLPIEDLVTASFSLYNDTTASSVTITSATESATVPGRYVFVIPSQTTTDDATLSLSTDTTALPFADGTWSAVTISFD